MGPWIPMFGTTGGISSGFQSQSGPYTFPETHLWCETCWPLGSQQSIQANHFHIPASIHWWDLSLIRCMFYQLSYAQCLTAYKRDTKGVSHSGILNLIQVFILVWLVSSSGGLRLEQHGQMGKPLKRNNPQLMTISES